MTIRGTVNEGIKRVVRSVQGESLSLVLAGADEANAVTVDRREIDALAAFQTTTPGRKFNGTIE